MNKATSITLTGPQAGETARALVARLIELGRPAQPIESSLAGRLGPAAAVTCGLLSRNGVMVVISTPGILPEGEHLPIDLDPNDTPDFAAEKALDILAEAGIISLDVSDYTPEEEEQIRKRLADLGYIE